MKTLPTPRVVFWKLFGSGFLLVLSIAIFLSVVGANLVVSVFGIVGIVGSLLGVLLGVERWRAMRTGRLGRGRLERFFDNQMTQKVDESSDVLLDAVSRAPDLAESATEMLSEAAEKALSSRKSRGLERLTEAVRVDLLPGEKTLVVVQAIRVPHGAKRALIWLTLGFAMVASMKSGMLTMTDRRLLFHAYRRRNARLLIADPLADVSVLEWFKGLGAAERMFSVLIVKRPDGSTARFQIQRFWQNEGRTAFELLSSVSKHPPAALANYWRDELAGAEAVVAVAGRPASGQR